MNNDDQVVDTANTSISITTFESTVAFGQYGIILRINLLCKQDEDMTLAKHPASSIRISKRKWDQSQCQDIATS